MTSFRQVLTVVTLAFATYCSSTAAAGNKYPIILVHGFAGWAREELGGMKYWGGFHGNWQQDLNNEGYDVRTAVVGPFSSNWDRACELYAYIKGGQVNYGKNHAKTHGHSETGRTYPGLFPEWGTVVNGEVQKVHIIAHSMGGQTARMLAQLLEHGTEGAAIQEDGSSSELFIGGKNWIHSITTVASPNQGTLLANMMDTFGKTVENMVGAIVGTLDVFGGGATKLFDAKLDQWGLAPRANGEKIQTYMRRVFESPVVKAGSKDLCIYSLSAAGAKEENKWVKTLPDIFYYSVSNSDTFRLFNIELPRSLSMLLPLQPLSVFLGSTYAISHGFSKDWQRNDGVVNTESMKSDGIGELVEGVSQSKTGRWQHVGLFNTLDHEGVVGVKFGKNAYDVYKGQARVLYELPATSATRRNLRTGPIVHDHSEEVTRHLATAFEAINASNQGNDAELLCASPPNEEIRSLCEQHFRSL